MHFSRRATLLTIGGAMVAGLSLAAGLATAGTAVATHYNVPLAGYVVQGNGLQPYSDVRSDLVDLPNLGTAVEPDSIAVGVAMGEDFSTGGQVFGLGAVWDDTSHAVCNAGQYTVEDGAAFDSSSPQPVPVDELEPVTDGGSPICLNPGQSQWFELYHSTGLREIDVITGPTEGDSDVVDVFTSLHHFPIAADFRDPAIGLTTTTGQSQNIPTGTTFYFGGAGHGGVGNGLTLLRDNEAGASQVRVTLANQNLGAYIGTEGIPTSTSPPSVSNPETLTPSGFGSGSSFTVVAP
jgi:hypothetical protein